MKNFLSSALEFTKEIFALVVFLLSGKKLLTPTGKRLREENNAKRREEFERNQKHIQKIQEALDEEHRRLRGWSKETMNEVIGINATRDIALQEEIAKTHKKLGFLF